MVDFGAIVAARFCGDVVGMLAMVDGVHEPLLWFLGPSNLVVANSVLLVSIVT